MAERPSLRGRRRRRDRTARLRLGVLLVGLGLGTGALLGLHVRGSIGSGAPAAATAPAPAAAPPRPTVAPGACIGDCLERDLGYSWAAAVAVRDGEGCAPLPPARRSGCLDYLRDSAARGAAER